MLRDPTGGGSDSEPSPTDLWLDHARHVLAEAAQPYDFYNVDASPSILGFEKPPELWGIWQPPRWDAIILPTDILTYRIPFFDEQRDLWALRDRNTGGVFQAPTDTIDGAPHPLLLPTVAAAHQWVELISGHICDLWPDGISPAERRMFGPTTTTFRPRTRAYPARPWHPDLIVDP